MQTMMAESAGPPAMKNAGRLSPTYGDDSFGIVVLVLAILLLVAGGMVMALWTNHGRPARGLLLHAWFGIATLVVMVVPLRYERPDNFFQWFQYMVEWFWPVGLLWFLLAALGFGLGSMVRPGKSRPRS